MSSDTKQNQQRDKPRCSNNSVEQGVMTPCSPERDKVLVTTSIPYVNGEPHIGFAMEIIEADAYARWARARGKQVFFLTGSDEHGSKIAKKAKELGVTPQELCDKNSARFRKLIDLLHISHDGFIRTTDAQHERGAQEIWKRMQASGKIEKRSFSGLYCVGCESFVTPKELSEKGECPTHLTVPEELEEENYFLRLSDYAEQITELLNSDTICIAPEFRKREIMSFLEEGLRDISISRPKTSLEWGIDVPGDDAQVMYVWAEALMNYVTGLGDDWERYWRDGKVVHFIGKDILRFHSVIWPIILMAADMPLPKLIPTHGFLTSEGHKMSKSLGNVVDPFQVVADFEGNPDPLRYYLLGEVPFGRDADFSQSRFLELYNAKLANGIGNTLARVLTLTKKAGVMLDESLDLPDYAASLSEQVDTAMEKVELHTALNTVLSVVDAVNESIDTQQPWKKQPEESIPHLQEWLRVLLLVAQELQPFLPHTAEKMEQAIRSGEKVILFPRR